MSDRILRITAAGGSVRSFFADTTEIVREAASIHALSPVAAAALGRTLSAAAILSVMMKGKNDTLTIQIGGGGPIGKITAAADSHANVRGYVDVPDVGFKLTAENKLDVGGAVGRNGSLTVIKDIGMKHPYIGSVRLQTGEIAEDFAYYFTVSEQTPTAIALGVLVDVDLTVKKAGGYLIQMMPGADEETVSYFENMLKGIKPLTEMLDSRKNIEDIADQLMLPVTYKINETSEVKYRCTCSQDRMEENVMAIGRKELLEMIEGGRDIEIVCHFCHSKYIIKTEDISKKLGIGHK